MKQSIFFILLPILLLGCNAAQNKSENNNKPTDTITSSDTVLKVDTSTVETNNETTDDEAIEIDIKNGELMALIKKEDVKLYNKVSDYIAMLDSDISSFDEILKIFEVRKQLVEGIESIIIKYEEINGGYYTDIPEWDIIEAELNQIGYTISSVEGMFGGLEISDILQNEIDKYAPNDYKLYHEVKKSIALKNYNNSEYPYLEMNNFFNIVVSYENLENQYPNSKYLDKLNEEGVENYINEISDVHYVYSIKNESTTYFTGDFNISNYPYETSKEQLQSIAENTTSKYANIVKKVLQNISNFEYENEMPTMFAVVIDKYDDPNIDKFTQVNDKRMQYLKKGQDIVHVIKVKTNADNSNNENYYTCYRYYSDVEKTKEALKKIKPYFPDAYIIQFSLIEYQGNYVADNSTLKIYK